MTGLDLSGASLAQARRLAEATATATDIDFVESDVYAAPAALGAPSTSSTSASGHSPGSRPSTGGPRC